MSTISGTIDHGITLGTSGSYASPLTITSTGNIFSAVATAVSGPASGTVDNSGAIESKYGYPGIYLHGAAEITNRQTGSITNGVRVTNGTGTVRNYGHIASSRGSGIDITAVGFVTNTGTISVTSVTGGGRDVGVYTQGGTIINGQGGLISSSNSGIDLRGAGLVINAGTIRAGNYYATAYGVLLENGGSVTNSGTIIGGIYSGVGTGAVTVTNSGTIISGHTGGGALFVGGVYLLDGGTLINAGSIIGQPGAPAVSISMGGRLIVDPGAVFVGKVSAEQSTIELAVGAATGTLRGLGTSFVNFGTVTVDAGARWVLSGSNTIGAGATLSTIGTLTDAGTLVDAGTIRGSGRLIVKSGGSEIVVSGGVASGTVLSGGSEIVSAGGRASGSIVASGGHESVHGTTSADTVNSGGHQTISAGGMASGVTVKAGGSQTVLSGGTTRGTVLSGGSEVVSSGGTASGGTILDSGGHQFVGAGGMASGVTVKHGGNQTVNAGGVTRGTVLSGGVESVHGTASGGTVDSGGTETVYGKASGGTINGGLIEVASGGSASGTVAFLSGGTLQLEAGAGFTGTIKGFAIPDRIDLREIAFGAGTTRSFTEAAGNTSGTLTVTDGTHTVHLTFLGLYTTSSFKLSTDNHGGTRVTDPPAAGGAPRLTFADIAPAGLPAGVATRYNPANYFPGTIATNEQPYVGQTLLATGPPRGGSLIAPVGGADHHPLLPAAH